MPTAIRPAQRARYLPLILSLAVACALALGTTTARGAENDGQEALDKALALKVSAQSVAELSQVVTLCEEALEAGLDESNTKFAKNLAAASLLQRAGMLVGAYFAGGPVPPELLAELPRRRGFALQDLERALSFDPEQPQALYLIARLHSLPGGNRDRARKAVDEAIRLAGDDTLLAARAHVTRAAMQTDPEELAADLAKAVELAPEEPEVLRASAAHALEQKDLDRALELLAKVVELEPQQANNHEMYGMALALDQQFDEALAELDEALELSPDDASARMLRARVRISQSKPEGAVEDIDEVFTTRPATADALMLRALAYQQMGKLDLALADINEALDMNPNMLPARRLRAILLANSGKMDEALADLESVHEAEPDDVETILQIAALYRGKKNASRAIEFYGQALEIDPQNWLVLHSRADALLSIGKQAEALADYEAAIKLEEKNANLLNNLAWLLATSPKDALRDAKRSLELATQACELTEYKEAYILSTLAAAYAESGDFDKAIEWSTKAVENSPANLKANIEKELASYKEGKPWRELQEDGDLSPDEEPAPSDDKPSEENPTEKDPKDSESESPR